MDRRLTTLALGAFVVAADGTLVVGLLHGIAHELAVSAGAAGQAVSVFGALYALAGPPLMLLLRRLPQKRLLVGSLALFAASNVATGLAANLPSLLAARALAAAAAAMFMPAAAVAAAAGLARERRGRALSAVVSGAAAGTAIGVPAGTLLGAWAGWRSAFFVLAGVAIVVALAAVAFPSHDERAGPDRPPARLDVRGAVPVLAFTGLWALGSFTFFTYASVVLGRTAGVATTGVGLFLLLFGASGVAGSRVAGRLTDARGPRTTLLLAVPTIAVSLAGLALLSARAGGDALGTAGSAVLIALYGLATWAVTPPQQHRLLASGGDERLLLSLNASALYAGVAVGAVAGGLILSLGGGPASLCWVAAGLELLGLSLLALYREGGTYR
ncbi:MAG TPA: MFS transporter [Gaiellaceae bacterium]|nr:MFS transporter [Gaiellaceae bacterium]